MQSCSPSQQCSKSSNSSTRSSRSTSSKSSNSATQSNRSTSSKENSTRSSNSKENSKDNSKDNSNENPKESSKENSKSSKRSRRSRRSKRSKLSGSTAHIPIYCAVLPTGIHYYTDKDLKKAKKDMHRILDKMEASDALITEFFEYIWDHPYILVAFKSFKDVLVKKVDALLPFVSPTENLYHVLLKVKSTF